MLFRPPRGGLVPRKKLEARFALRAHNALRRHIRGASDGGTMMKSLRALSRVQLGELWRRDKLQKELGSSHRPTETPTTTQGAIKPTDCTGRTQLDTDEFLVCLRKSRRGTAVGPSGVTLDHLFPLLESEADSQLFAQVGVLLSVGNVPEPILEGIRLGRMTALQKPDGGVRGIVVGDTIRRLVARTMAKQVSKQAEVAIAPFSTPSPPRQDASALLTFYSA